MLRAKLMVWIVVSLLIISISRGDEKPKVSVTLTSPRYEYLLGEPVILEVAVRNDMTDTIKAFEVFVKNVEPEIKVYFSQDGQTFQEYEIGIYLIHRMSRRIKILKPGEVWKYELRVLYTLKNPSGLAFEQPGIYFLKVIYPLWWAESKDRLREILKFPSNVIRVQILQPTGLDEKVWERIKSNEFLYFIQSGWVKLEWEEVEKFKSVKGRLTDKDWVEMWYGKTVVKVIEVLQSFPESRYHPTLREALRLFYEANKFKLTSEQVKTLRSVLGIR